MKFNHISVLLDESIRNLNIREDGIYVDGTLGGAGHSCEIVKRLGKEGLLIGIDQDENAIKAASSKLEKFSEKITLVRDNFSNLKAILETLNIDRIDGLLLDLGVSSHQLDEPERGFSYMHDAPLDMRMDNRNDLTAKDVVNHYSQHQLEEIIRNYGEEKWTKRIVQYIIQARETKEISTTYELVNIIKKAIPLRARKEGPHPAKRTFQAIRIEVNRELEIIENTIVDAVEKMNKGGRICIITFHSLEDRIVKNIFKRLSNPCTCPPQFPVCRCNNKPTIKVISRKPIVPTEVELQANSRARSAKLRVAERI